MKDLTNGHLDKVKDFAQKIGMIDNLNEMLNRLDIRTENHPDTEVELYEDWAPYSFAWAWVRKGIEAGERGRLIMNGGLIFHGAHDSGGNGGPPTFAVCLTATKGWSIHT